MRRRDISKALLATAGSTVVAQRVEAQSCTAPCYAQTAAELAAGVTPTNTAYAPGPWIDVRRYGADPTGAANSDAALASAITVCGTNGGTIWFAPGSYKFANQYNWTNLTNITIQGAGGNSSGGNVCTILTYTGTAATWISMPGALGIRFRDVKITYSNSSFSGALLSYGHSTQDSAGCGLFDCQVGGLANSAGCIHLGLDKTITFTAERCIFQGGSPSVVGMAAGSYSNVIRFRDCEFWDSTVAPIYYGGLVWVFEGCVFNPLVNSGGTNGFAGAYLGSSGHGAQDIAFIGCNFDNPPNNGGTWIVFYGQGLTYQNNWMAGGGNATHGISLNSASAVNITGNYFVSLAHAMDTTSGGLAAITFTNNVGSSVTNMVTNSGSVMPGNAVLAPNFPAVSYGPGWGVANLAAQGYETSPNGVVRMWGVVTVTSGTPATVTFSSNNGIPFPNSCWAVTFGPGTAASGNIAQLTAVSRTAFTVAVTGSGSNNIYWEAVGN